MLKRIFFVLNGLALIILSIIIFLMAITLLLTVILFPFSILIGAIGYSTFTVGVTLIRLGVKGDG